MKPAHEYAKVIITTSQQRCLITQLMADHLEEGGSILAQVFFDGFRVRVLTPDQAKDLAPAVNRALGQQDSTNQISCSVFNHPGDIGAAP